jgi:hypothetical protein
MPDRFSLGTQPPRTRSRRAGPLLCAILLLRLAPLNAQAVRKPEAGTLGATVARLSEPGGFFDTDNLISNESSYLHAVTRLQAIGTSSGAYIGVGPDQNFSYIAAIKAHVAYILDVRRDNLLQHLMFKALFERSRNRMDYLCRWLGRRPPENVEAWNTKSIEDIVGWIGARPPDEAFAATEQAGIVAAAKSTGIALSAQDVATIRRFHSAFVKDGLDLRFTSFNRGPRPYYPTLRQLILERDLDGRMASYLAREESWGFLKGLQVADRVIPVVGNLAGNHALSAIGRDVAARGEKVQAIYTSNVEQYIWRDGTFPHFAETVTRLPHDSRSAIIRSYFGGGYGGQGHPLAKSGHYSVQLVQTLDDFIGRHRSGGWGSYWELVTLGAR